MTTDDARSLTHDQLVERLMESQATAQRLEMERGSLQVQRDALEMQRAALEAENAELAGKLQYALKALYGPSSERTRRGEDPGQQSLFGAPVAAAPAAEREQIVYERDKAKPKGHGRAPVSRTLRTVERIIAASASERTGPRGEALVLTGYEVSEKLDLIPEELIRLVLKREQWGLPDTRETLLTAAVEPCLIPKGKATDGFLHEVIVRKFHLGLPLHRQLMDLNNRGAGVNASWLSDAIKQVAAQYAPIHAAIRLQILAHPFVHADETPIRQQTDDGIRTGYFWALLAGTQMYVHYGATRAQREARQLLGIADDGEWEERSTVGFLVCDGYAGYNPVFADGRVKRVACWAHVRRKFDQAALIDRNAVTVVERINDLFRIERQARKDCEKQRLDAQAAAALHLARRQGQTVPLLAQLRQHLEQLVPLYSTGSCLRVAIDYTFTLWEALTMFTTDGRLPADNNAAERSIRPLVVGRKGWLFVGSEDAGGWAAIFFSLMESCRMCGIDPRRYLAHVTPLLVSANPPEAALLTPLAVRTTLATH